MTPTIAQNCRRCGQLLRRPSQSIKKVRISITYTRCQSTEATAETTLARSRRHFTNLRNRTLIKLDGPGAETFLHNLTPADVSPLEDESRLIFSAFLNAKGRILHDIFIRKPGKENGERWYLDVDSNSAPAVMSHLKKHKLRSQFKLEKLTPEQGSVTFLWPGSEPIRTGALKDPRPGMGHRIYHLADDKTNSDVMDLAGLSELPWQEYMIFRMVRGFAEGPVEIASGSALPQESNLDIWGGIDFHKGCYLGQELTIRTHHTGVVRKRILPVQIYADQSPIPVNQEQAVYDSEAILPQPLHEANISKCGARGRAGRSTGKWLGGYGNIGLALCRLEMMTDLSLTGEPSTFNVEEDEFEVTWESMSEAETKETKSVKVKAFVPSWLRVALEESAKARSDRGRRKRETGEDESELESDAALV